MGGNYTIDLWGNLTNRSGVAGKTNTELMNCVANNNNQLTTCSMTYDTAGNVDVNSGTTYAYDAENRIVSPGTGTYLYDGDGRRTALRTRGLPFGWRNSESYTSIQ